IEIHWASEFPTNLAIAQRPIGLSKKKGQIDQVTTMGWGGGGGGWGGKGGKGGWSPWQPMFMKWGKGKGFGKGKGLKVDPALKCWIGNLADGTNWKALQEHMNQAGKTTWVECFSGKGNGTGGVSYSTAEEAANAITMLNGSLLNGQAIMVDVWVKQTAS
ncbi:unnamed protein product, partial [Effrenium voratum]